jgi:hypothetical protein
MGAVRAVTHYLVGFKWLGKDRYYAHATSTKDFLAVVARVDRLVDGPDVGSIEHGI